jgi:hypothetical protein
MDSFVIYYTYTHSTPSGEIFYIGKGHDNRAFSYRDRGWAWKEAVAKAKGILIKIESEWSTEQEAFEHEIFLIKHHKELGAKLVNLTEGGSGPLGFKQSEKTRALIKEKMTGYVHKEITCPHCNTTGGETTMKRWHFDNCTGAKIFKARTTIFGKRIFLGNYATKEISTKIAKEFYEFIMQENNHLTMIRL